MALSNIIGRINAHAEEEARSILAEAEARAAKVEADARKRAGAALQEARERAQANAEAHKKRLITLASLDLRKQVGDAKQKAIETAFLQALDRIGKMGDADYLPLLRELIVEAAITGNEQLVLSPKDRVRVDEAFLASVNKALEQKGKKGNLKFSKETRQVLGGVILVGDNIEVNCTFDSTLKLIRDDIEPNVASLLWSDARSK